MHLNRATYYFLGEWVSLLWKFQAHTESISHRGTEFGKKSKRNASLIPIRCQTLLFSVPLWQNHSSSSLTPCMRFIGQPARSQPFTNGSRSPSITPCTLLVSTPVRRSFTIRYGWKT